MNKNSPLTPLNHGLYADPHPQYSYLKNYSSPVDFSNFPWLKIFEVNVAEPNNQIAATIQRMYFGFKILDSASDSLYSVAEFTGFIGTNGGHFNVTVSKKFLNRTYQNPGNRENTMNLHVFRVLNNNVFNVKCYLEMPWNYKRATIVQPWVIVPSDRYTTTQTYPLTAKISQREKTDFLFSQIKNRKFISLADMQADTQNYIDYVNIFNDDASHTLTLSVNGVSLTIIRTMNFVNYSFHGTTAHTAPAGTSLGNIPVGYRPASTLGISTFLYENANDIFPLQILSDGSINVITTDIPTGKIMYGSGGTATIDPLPQ